MQNAVTSLSVVNSSEPFGSEKTNQKSNRIKVGEKLKLFFRLKLFPKITHRII